MWWILWGATLAVIYVTRWTPTSYIWWILLGVTLGVIYVTWKTTAWLRNRKICRQKIAASQEMVRRQREELEDRLKEDGVLVTAERERIVHLPVKELLQQLQDGQLKAVQVLHAFQAKAIEATKKTNCVAVFISEAEEWAQELDRCEIRGPLHGLPVSVKECFNMVGYVSTCGFTKRLGKPSSADAVIVSVLKTQGAVPFCKTNLPQTMMSYDCSNPIYGTTVHPDNPSRTPGGSSGGEGALIAQRGSPLGLGTDLAGSVRAPAFCCGIPALKVTSDRLSFVRGNGTESGSGIQGLKSCAGFMGPDVAAVAVGTRALLDGSEMYQQDPTIPPLPWREHLFSDGRKLRVGYYEEDGTLPPTPGCRRAVQEAVAALREAGHQLIPFRPPDIPRAIHLAYGLYFADERKTFGIDMLAGEIIDPILYMFVCMAYLPRFLVYLLKPLMNYGLIPTVEDGFATSYSLWQAMAERSSYIKDVIHRWSLEKLDVCISPGMPLPAQPLGYPSYNFSCGNYSILYNLLDFTAGMIPVTRETKEDQKKLKDYPTGNSYYRKITKQATVGAVGMPIGVQVIGLPWQEELVLRGMLELEAALRQQKT